MHVGNEGQLIQLAKRGDPDAMGELYQRHVDRVYRYVRYRVHDETVAEDIAADVFMRAMEGLAAYNDRGLPFEAWLYRIAHARVIDHWRRQQRRSTVQLDDPSLHDWLQVEDETSEADVLQYRSLLAALRQLTDDQQQVIVLKFMSGCDNAEIARIMDKTEGAVKALQRRGLEALSRLVEV